MIRWALRAGVALVLVGASATMSLQAVTDYYASVSGGTIAPSPGAEGRTDRFKPVRGRLPKLRSHPPREPELDHDLLHLDVAAFVAQAGAGDLQEARRAYYARLPWLHEHQAHDRPYPYLEGWNDLFHPPIRTLRHPRALYWRALGGPPPPRDGQPWFDPAFQIDLDDRTGTALTAGNALDLLQSGEAFHEKLRLVRSAQRTLYVAVMFFACDRTSNMLADSLIERAQAGVDVRFVTEEVYRQTLERRCVDRLVHGGVKVASVRASGRRGSLGAVMHQKIWIRDGQEMILGGQNILDFENLATGFNLMDRDLDVLVEGPSVTDAVRAFHDTWEAWSDEPIPAEHLADTVLQQRAQREAGLRGAEHYPAWLSDPGRRTTGLCRLAMQDLMAERQPITPIIDAHLRATRDLVAFSTPTLTVDIHDPVNEHLVDTPLGGLMRLIQDGIPGATPHFAIASNGRGGGAGELSTWLHRRELWFRQANRPRLSRIFGQYRDAIGLRASARNRPMSLSVQRTNPDAEVWWYFQYLHSKLWVFDRTVTMVSSYNVDVNSAHLNSENAIFCMDDGLTHQAEYDLLTTFINSVPVVSSNE